MSFGSQEEGLAYRPEIDGLRALAVLGVMLFHGKLAGAEGGFTGVDVFLVISGYLITGIILRDMMSGRFRFRDFLLRRARRIFPALFTVILATALAGLLLPTAEQLESLGRSGVAALLFLANVHFWREGQGYFDDAAELNPLMHLWSLSLEEQFYLVLPPALLLLLLPRFRRYATPLLLAAALVSFALAELLSTRMPAAAYYLLPTRASEFLAGSLLAMAPSAKGAVETRLHKLPLASIGVAMLLAPYFLLDADTPFPGVATLPTVIGTLLVLRYANPVSGVGRLLASPPLVALGLVSYSTFLWHQPVLAFGRVLPMNALGPLATCALLLLAIALGALTWRIVEQPLRRPGRVGTRSFVIGCGLFWAACVALSGWFVLANGVPARLGATALRLGATAQQARVAQSACYVGLPPARSVEQACRTEPAAADGPNVAIIGDSHAAAIAPAIVDAARRNGAGTLLLANSSCPPIRAFRPFQPDQTPCPTMLRSAFARIADEASIRTVVLAARWTLYFERSYPDNGEGGMETGTPLPPASDADLEALAASIRDTVRWLIKRGKRVVIVYPVPEAGWDVPRWMAKAHRYGVGDPQRLSVSTAWVENRSRAARRALDSLPDHPRLFRVDPAKGLCDPQSGRCALVLDGVPLYFDDDHLSATGARAALSAAAPALDSAIGDSVAKCADRQQERGVRSAGRDQVCRN
ncbi:MULTISPECIES: acyltransferase family protein [unclassified Sphingomonas]|uniref:acyltransferase family protein n=1 Tax=unclassified Sphingomonas TaxID=196159 RepID=UPI002150E07A|nr:MULTISPECIES: acyltransferase family protein [unclassified Sphingomonas]MCR5871110.1 acyltransferase [Sphingomonas sp. J344]UUY00574.1 acyltransferase [Sphingomonas sp. J315]